jgi:hypothetical protein
VTLYYAAAGIDVDGKRSTISDVIEVVIPAGTDTNKVDISGLVFDTGASTMMIYRGRDPQALIGGPQTLAATFTDDGTGLWGSQSPVDPELDSTITEWRRVAGVPIGPYGTDIYSASTIGASGSPPLWTPGANVGKLVEIVRGTGWGQRRRITSDDGSTLGVSPDWQESPDTTSVFVVHYHATSGTADTVSDSTQAWPDSSLIGLRVRVIQGDVTRIYQERTIIANTGTEIQVDTPWDVVPDTDCDFELVGGWQQGGQIKTYDEYFLVTTTLAEINLPNEPGMMIEYRAIGVDRDGGRSDDRLAPVGRYVVVGAPIGATGDIIRTDEIDGNDYKLVLRGGVSTWDPV